MDGLLDELVPLQYVASQPQLLEQVQELVVSPYAVRLELFDIARKGFATRLKVKTAGNMHLVSASDLVDIKAELFNDYCASFLKFLSPGLLRLQAVTLTSQLARCLMGSAGGTGCDWGVSRLQAFDATENPDPAKVCAPTALPRLYADETELPVHALTFYAPLMTGWALLPWPTRSAAASGGCAELRTDVAIGRTRG